MREEGHNRDSKFGSLGKDLKSSEIKNEDLNGTERIYESQQTGAVNTARQAEHSKVYSELSSVPIKQTQHKPEFKVAERKAESQGFKSQNRFHARWQRQSVPTKSLANAKKSSINTESQPLHILDSTEMIQRFAPDKDEAASV